MKARVLLTVLTLLIVARGTIPAAQVKLPVTGSTRTVIKGEDGNPAFGAPLSYKDNGDGTITDNNTQLMWEKKVALDGITSATNLHDADNIYQWSSFCSLSGAHCGTASDCASGQTCSATDGQGTGMTVFEWAAALNAAGFAG